MQINSYRNRLRFNMKKFLTSIFFLVLISSESFATETVIKGKIIGFEAKNLKLGYYNNYITNSIIWVENEKIENEKFSFSVDIDAVRQFVLKVEDKETSLFAMPGEVYVLKVTYNEEANQGQTFNKVLDLSFPFPKPTGINEQIKKFNKAYQSFMADNYRFIMIKQAAKQTAEFISTQNNVAESYKNTFVKNYIKYALANLEDILGNKKNTLIDKYLVNQAVLHKNKEYINFFTQLFNSDFEQLALKKSGVDLMKAILIEENTAKVVKEINSIYNFKNKELAELYVLNALYSTRHKRVIKEQNAERIITDLAKDGTSNEIKQLAGSVLEDINKYNLSKKAPAFTLKDANEQEHSLSDFEGKITYLNFWSNTSIPSLRELKVIQKLKEEYGKEVNFVSINLDTEADNKAIKEKYGFEWPFLHYGNDYELREKYQIATVPAYFIIDEKGNMMKAFAENPVEADRTFHNMFNR